MIQKALSWVLNLFAFSLPLSIGAANTLAATALILWLLSANRTCKLKKLYSLKPFWVWIGIGALTLLSALFSSSSTGGFIAQGKDTLFQAITIHYLLLPTVMLITFSTLRTSAPNTSVVSWFLSGIFLSEIISYALFFGWIEPRYFIDLGILYERASAKNPTPFLHHLEYSVFLNISALLLLYRMLQTKAFKLKLFYAVFFLGVSANLFINGGRTGQIGYFLSISVMLFYLYKHNILQMVLGLGLLIGVAFTAYHTSPNFHKRINHALNDIRKITHGNFNSSWGSRAISHQVVFSFLTSSPQRFIFGAGAGDTRDAYIRHAKENFTAKTVKPIYYLAHLHNQIAMLWMDGGIFSVFLFFGFFYFMAKTPLARYEKALLYGFLIAIFFAAMTDVPFYRYQPAMLIYLISGYLLSLARQKT